jgi:hypothetical protein
VSTRLFDDGWRGGFSLQLSFGGAGGLFEGAELIIAAHSEICREVRSAVV